MIHFPTESTPCHIHYHFKNGLKDQLELMKLSGIGNSFFNPYIEKEFDGFSIEIAFAFRNYNVDSSIIQSFANYHHTTENGTHVQGLLKGLTYGVMKYFQKQDFTNEYKISQKGIQENLIALIHIKMDTPSFSGCVKNKLANAEVIEPIKEWVDITGYDSNSTLKKIAIPLLQNEKNKSNYFKTWACSHHCNFRDTTSPSNNYEWIISSPCKSQSCGNAYSCYLTFYD